MAPYQENQRGFWRTVKHLLLRTLGAAAMGMVFLLGAFGAMRLAIHGREVGVPALANLSDTDAAEAARKLGLNLSVENRFYSATVPPNHVLSQSPLPGSRVRRGWQIRVTESLGSQQVPVPDVTGQNEQPASLMLRRLQLELGTVAHIPGPRPTGVVLAQSPPPNVSGIDGPRVGLLIADEENTPASVGYVMPSIVGMTFGAAQARLGAVGLHLSVPVAPDPEPVISAPTSPTMTGAPTTSILPAQDAGIPAAVAPRPAVSRSSAVITSQSPQPGRRVSRADAIHVVLAE